MGVDVGELLVGAYFKIIERCDVVSYNVRPAGGKLLGLEELDVVGLKFEKEEALLAEVTTHLGGALYGSNQGTVDRIKRKFERQKRHAEKFLAGFPNRRYMFWSPRVPVGFVTGELEKIAGLEVIVNRNYTERINELREKARTRMNDENNDAFRLLQILEHLRR